MGVLVVSVGGLAILIGLKKPDTGTHTTSIELVDVTQEVTLGEDIVIGVNNSVLYVPKGATNLPGTISMTPRSPNLFSNAPEKGWLRSPVVNVEYWDSQGTLYSDVSFTVPVQICFKITDELWQAYGQRPDQFQVQYYAEYLEPPRWQPLPLTANPDRLQLCGQTDHLSIFALAIRQEGTVPVTGSSPVPNSSPTPFTIINFFNNLFGLDADDPTAVPNPIVPPGVVVTAPPATAPPATEPPATEPPATEPPATEPPATEPPATEPPATEPPATEPPATEPPATEPPATEPPATEPPATEPPATEPPATEPPATEPPVTEPLVTEPPVTEPPVIP